VAPETRLYDTISMQHCVNIYNNATLAVMRHYDQIYNNATFGVIFATMRLPLPRLSTIAPIVGRIHTNIIFCGMDGAYPIKAPHETLLW
jgi:hypothetical protein